MPSVVCGALCTGEAQFLFCGRRQVVPVVHAAAMHKKLSCLLCEYATRLGCCVSDGAAALNSSHAVASLCFASGVHELVAVRADDGEADEWMYELEQRGSSSSWMDA
eukprot:PhM_4_TR2077/c2_g2_i2/m.6865